MGGKKKSLANRLARMSDEERARYLQHKADIEEEARRRKEQLIAIFMKNKIKREDGFSRLNLAKINQHWHQILRLNKCKEMREDVEHMKKYIDRVLEYKNRTIDKLLEELEMAEDQYGHNFQAHVTHIDQIIASHVKYMQLLEEQYQKDLEQLLETAGKEQDELAGKNLEQHQHLQTVIFGEESRAKAGAKADRERYLKKKEEVTSTFRLQLDSFVKQRENRCGALWREIATVIKSHVTQTDARRLHLAELKRIDAESAAEIATNQERINCQEEEIRTLTVQFERLTAKRTETIRNLSEKIKTDTRKLFAIRKKHRKRAEKDEKRIVLLTHASNRSIDVLHNLRHKGEQIVKLMMTCRKFETAREQVTKWLPLGPTPDVSVDEDELQEMKKRGKSAECEEMVKKVVISAKSPQESTSTSHSKEEDIVDAEFGLLMDMERFWLVYNKVDLELKELKQEKRLLEGQNKDFRGTIRAVLEAAALDRSTPNSKVPTRAPSKRGAQSAPLRRILI
ncbi:unnamed protein product [Tenebrio molitor]|nr:unnamed protein product [Tenebrio molitor]